MVSKTDPTPTQLLLEGEVSRLREHGVIEGGVVGGVQGVDGAEEEK